MKLSLGITTSIPPHTGIGYAKLAESSGYHRVWLGEDIPSRDVFTYMSILALRTNSIRLGIGITSPLVRHVAVLASSAVGIQELSGGRFTLGIGPGGIPEVERLLGKKPEAVVESMDKASKMVKELLSGGEISTTSQSIHIDGFSLIVKTSRPDLFFGVRGPRLLKLAGRVADGVILSGPEGYIKEALDTVNRSAEKEGRDPREIKKVLWNALVEVREPQDLEMAKMVAATILSSMPTEAVLRLGVSKDQLELIKGYSSTGDYRSAFSLIEDTVLSQLCIYGSVKDIVDTFKEYESMGIDEVVVGPPFGKRPEEVIENVARCLQ